MAAPKHSDLLSSGTGLAATVAIETHGDLGEVDEIKARGSWEQVWLRFRRDRVAIVGGVFIVALLLVAFVGRAPGGAPARARAERRQHGRRAGRAVPAPRRPLVDRQHGALPRRARHVGEHALRARRRLAEVRRGDPPGGRRSRRGGVGR